MEVLLTHPFKVADERGGILGQICVTSRPLFKVTLFSFRWNTWTFCGDELDVFCGNYFLLLQSLFKIVVLEQDLKPEKYRLIWYYYFQLASHKKNVYATKKEWLQNVSNKKILTIFGFLHV